VQQQIISAARSWLGTQYHHQGRLKRSHETSGGVDCIGLIIGVAKELGLRSKTGKLLAEFDETDYSPQPDGVSLARFLETHLIPVKKEKIKPADALLFKIFKHPRHVGVATNYNNDHLGIIHCYSGSGKVVEHVFSESWQRMLVAGYRFCHKNK
jgi:cell wall-associated NlpC family hydrolase